MFISTRLFVVNSSTNKTKIAVV